MATGIKTPSFSLSLPPVRDTACLLLRTAVLDSGANVIIASSTQSKVDDALTRLGSASASGRTIDVSSDEQLEGFFAKVGDFDHLVYTAGDALRVGPFEKVSLLRTCDEHITPGSLCTAMTHLWAMLPFSARNPAVKCHKCCAISCCFNKPFPFVGE